MISLASFKPEYFNANGDQGNIEVISKQLYWRGLDFQAGSSDFSTANFLLVGDGSRAAMKEFEPALTDLVPLLQGRLQAGAPTLLVGSAHEYFAGKLDGFAAHKTVKRASEFREATTEGLTGFGYRNTTVVQDLFVSGAFISTSLFGPVLAKSPELLKLILAGLGVTSTLPEPLEAELGVLAAEIKRRAIAG